MGPDGGSVDVTFMRSLRLLKLSKILRMVRVMRFFSELRLILNSLLGSLISLFWAIVMLALIYYIFGLLFVQGIIPYLANRSMADPIVEDSLKRFYGSVELSMMTLFQASTGGDDWSMFYEALVHTGGLNCVLFVFFILFIEIALMNILTGIFVENAMKLAQPDRDAMALEIRKREKELEDELRKLCQHFDTDGSGYISREKFAESLEHGKMKANLAVLGLDIKDAELFLGMLAEASGEKEVNVDAFIHGCMRLKGTATSLDMQLLVFGTSMVYKCQKQIQRDLRKFRYNFKSMETTASPNQIFKNSMCY